MSWTNFANDFGADLIGGAVAALIGCILFIIGAAIYVSFRRSREQRAFRMVLRPLRLIAPIAFAAGAVCSVGLDLLLSDACGTSQVTEFPSPDRKHRIIVYAFDCGATTDFSLEISLLDGDDQLPQHRLVNVLYSRYHDQPGYGGFEVDWQDARNVTVKLADYKGNPSVKQDGVAVRFASMR